MQLKQKKILHLSLFVMIAFLLSSCGYLIPRAKNEVLTSPSKQESLSQKQNISIHRWMIHGYDYAFILLSTGKILRTQNSGKTWITVFDITSSVAEEMYFINDHTGWVITEKQEVYKSDDGGANWQLIGSLPTSSGDNFIKLVNFTTENNGFVLGTEYFGVTSDGGKNWANYKIWRDNKKQAINHCSFSSPSVGWITTTNGLLKSENGGKTWNRINFMESAMTAPDIFWLDSKVGWVLNEELYSTLDGGGSWDSISPPKNNLWVVNSFQFLNSKLGWIVGEDALIFIKNQTPALEERKGIIAITTDGGKNWKTLSSPEPGILWSVKFTDEKHGWVGSHTTLYNTEDGGATWRKAFTAQ